MSIDKGHRSEQIASEAAEWFARNRDAELSGAEQALFSQWLAESAVHVREYLAIAETWGALQSPQVWPQESTAELLEALRNADRSNVVALDSATVQGAGQEPHPHAPTTIGKRRMPWMRVMGVAASLVVAAFALVYWNALRGDVYTTARGEQRSVVLPDGSVVQLNTLTRMIVHFDSGHRRIELPKGEAFFRVAHDSSRPFDVETPFAVVRAVGTEFNVYARARSTQIAVVEGKVRVARVEREESAQAPASNEHAGAGPHASAPPIALDAQQSVNISGDAATNEEPAVQRLTNSQAATAWIQRRLIFDNERVDAIVEEFNRYSQSQMRVDDPALAGLRITGVFDADDPAAFIKYLEQIQLARVKSSVQGIVLEK